MWVTEHNATNKPYIQGSQICLLFNLSYTLAFSDIFRDTILILPEGPQDYYIPKITIKEIISIHPDIVKNNKRVKYLILWDFKLLP